jgi:hypothetical protein
MIYNSLVPVPDSMQATKLTGSEFSDGLQIVTKITDEDNTL